MLKNFLFLLIIGVIFLAANSFFIVNQATQAVKLRFGEIVQVVNPVGEVEGDLSVKDGPGLYFKYPLFDRVERFDRRNLMLDLPKSEVTIVGNERITVDSFAQFRIHDPATFYKTVRNVRRAQTRLGNTLNAQVRNTLGGVDQQTILSDKRANLMTVIRDRVNQEAQENALGLVVVDVRIKRADLPEQNQENVYMRMEAERREKAAEIRAEGQEEAQIIRAAADREVIEIKAKAQEQAEITRGEGEENQIRIFGEAYNLDPEFADLYRSLQAYRKAMTENDTLVLSPENEFFRYFEKEDRD